MTLLNKFKLVENAETRMGDCKHIFNAESESDPFKSSNCSIPSDLFHHTCRRFWLPEFGCTEKFVFVVYFHFTLYLGFKLFATHKTMENEKTKTKKE